MSSLIKFQQNQKKGGVKMFEDMNKERSNLSVGVFGPSGSGKTTAIFKIAMGIRDKCYPGEQLKDIGLLVDAEKRSSLKAVGRNVGGEVLEPMKLYNFEPPYTLNKLMTVLEYAVKNGIKIIGVDSYSLFWSGKDGILERVSELDVELADKKKMYGAWSEREIISAKNILKSIIRDTGVHIILSFRAKTEYVLETNKYGKQVPKAIGVKEDTQPDLRYEFDVVLSIDKDTHEVTIAKDNIGFAELRGTYPDPCCPISVQDGYALADIVTRGLTEKDIMERTKQKHIAFILSEKAFKSEKVAQLEKGKSITFTEEYCNKLSEKTLKAIAEAIKY